MIKNLENSLLTKISTQGTIITITKSSDNRRVYQMITGLTTILLYPDGKLRTPNGTINIDTKVYIAITDSYDFVAGAELFARSLFDKINQSQYQYPTSVVAV